MENFGIILSGIGIIFSILGLTFSILFLVKAIKLDREIKESKQLYQDLIDFQEYLCLENISEKEKLDTVCKIYNCSKARAMLILYKMGEKVCEKDITEYIN